MGKGFEEQIDHMKAEFTKELNLTAIPQITMLFWRQI
jgi:hypothetical protein